MSSEPSRESFESLCPDCKKKITAKVELDKGIVYSIKSCSDHGVFKDVICHDADYYKEIHRYWEKGSFPEDSFPPTNRQRGCPYDCLFCNGHRIFTLVAFIDVTYRCNLDCWICYANSGYRSKIPDPSAEQIVKIMKTFRGAQPPPKRVQFSGGEPTLRNDLPHLVRVASKLGFEEIGVNTNGIRLARSYGLCENLIKSGVTKISLQFDGVDDGIYRRIRGQDLFELKQQVIENVRKVGTGVVQLVCAVAKGVNDHEIPNILDFAAENADVISGVSFLPVAFCGREFDKSEIHKYRVTTPHIQSIINRHTDGVCENWPSTHTLVKHLRFVMFFLDGRSIGHSSHPECGSLQIVAASKSRGGRWKWHSLCDRMDFHKIEEESEKVWLRHQKAKRSKVGPLYLKKMQARMIWIMLKSVKDKRVAVRDVSEWLINRVRDVLSRHKTKKLSNLHEIFRNIKYLMIFCVNFQDLYNINVERIKRCTFHFGFYDPIDDEVRIVPFCSMNTVHRKGVGDKLIKNAEGAVTPRAVFHV